MVLKHVTLHSSPPPEPVTVTLLDNTLDRIARRQLFVQHKLQQVRDDPTIGPLDNNIPPDADRQDRYTDGSCTNNQRRAGTCQTAGYGVFFGIHDERNIAQPLAPIGHHNFVSNNRAELKAIISCLKENRGRFKLRIFTDSMYCINGATFKSSIKENFDLWNILFALLKLNDVVFVKVKGHSNSFGNTCADALAVFGGLEGPKIPVKPQLPWVRCCATLYHMLHLAEKTLPQQMSPRSPAFKFPTIPVSPRTPPLVPFKHSVFDLSPCVTSPVLSLTVPKKSFAASQMPPVSSPTLPKKSPPNSPTRRQRPRRNRRPTVFNSYASTTLKDK